MLRKLIRMVIRMENYKYSKPTEEYTAKVRSADMEKVQSDPFAAKDLVEKIYGDAAYEETLRSKRILVKGIYTKTNTAPDAALSIEISDQEGGKCYVLCVLENDKYLSDINQGDTVIVGGNFLTMDEDYNLILEKSRIESTMSKDFENYHASKMPTREKMDRVVVEVMPLFEQDAPFDCKELNLRINQEADLDAKLEYKRLDITGVASRFGTNPFKTPSIELSDEVNGKCYAFAVWGEKDTYGDVAEGDIVTVRGNYLWCNPQFGVVVKNPEILEVKKK